MDRECFEEIQHHYHHAKEEVLLVVSYVNCTTTNCLCDPPSFTKRPSQTLVSNVGAFCVTLES